MMYIKKHTIALILILVGLSTSSQSESKKKTKRPDIENSDTKKENTSSTPITVESRFFDLGGVMNQLFPGFNQGDAAGENSGLNLPSNSQFYPGVPAQNSYLQIPINQGNGGHTNQQNIQQPTSQNQGLPLDGNFNQQGSINNINQPRRNLNQGSLGQYPANLNGNPINGGWNQNGQGGNLQNSGFQQGQPFQLGGLQGQGPNLDNGPNEFDNQHNNNGPIGNSFNNPQYWAQDQGQSSMNQNNNGENSFNNQMNNQNSPYLNNQGQNFDQQRHNNFNQQNRYPSGQLLGNGGVNSFPVQDTPRNQYEQVTEPNNMRLNNIYQTQSNINNNQAQNLNQQDTNVNNNNGITYQQFPGSNSWNNNRGNDQLTKPNQQTVNNGQDFNDGAIKFPDDYNYGGNVPMTTRITTTRPPQTESPTTKIAILGKPVSIPTTTVSSSQVTFTNNDDVPTAEQKQCVQSCPTSSEYNPVCGTDNVSYFNPGRLVCARNCGIRVFEARQGNCSNVVN